MKKQSNSVTEIQVLPLTTGRMVCYIRGITPLIYNAMSSKARRSLLDPEKKTQAVKAVTAKHNPLAEFRGSMYTSPTGPTLTTFPAVAFKRALASVATDLGGAKKAQVERLVWAIGTQIPVWGIPQLRMDVVRSADMNKTPDVRTRATLTEWACRIELAYVMPTINETTVANLLASAGLIRGIGDFRQEKGAGNYGQFELVAEDDADWKRIVKAGGRKEQQAAFDSPECYDGESESLFQWWQDEDKRRGRHTNGRDAEAAS